MVSGAINPSQSETVWGGAWVPTSTLTAHQGLRTVAHHDGSERSVGDCVKDAKLARRRTWLTLVGCSLLCSSTLAVAQTFYKWTDDSGVVHFADIPPANTANVEERSLPGAPAPQVNPPEDENAAAEEGRTPGVGEGPARLVLVSRRAPRMGPTAIHVSGEVKNVGGADAHAVSVSVTAVDSTAGTPCLHEDVSVTPSTLHPGESGNFDADIDDPCLSGGTPVDIAANSE
jgi:Domain of unknown function (DUF4124)